MAIKELIIVHTTSISKKIIEIISQSRTSVKIVMAWFTDNEIKDALIEQKRKIPSISIEILVDDNEVNGNYFMDYREKFNACGIVIHAKVFNKFLHSKFLIVDDKIIITGSYNLTKRAKGNLENIVEIRDRTLSSTYSRHFHFLTSKYYIDQNIQLLFDYPFFAQQLICSYYHFTIAEYRKYYQKILLGECYTYFNGSSDRVQYSPGFIFNPKVGFDKRLKNPEFDLPIQKKSIIEYEIDAYTQSVLRDAFENDDYDHLYKWIDRSVKNLESFYTSKVETTYNSDKLRQLIEAPVNIVIEDQLWRNNFELFISKELIESLFEKFSIVEKNYYDDFIN